MLGFGSILQPHTDHPLCGKSMMNVASYNKCLCMTLETKSVLKANISLDSGTIPVASSE